MAPSLDKPTVLIVDDSPDFRLLLSRYCKREGYETENLASAQLLFDQGTNLDQYCAVLLDILMPGMDGFEALRRIRETTRKVPVIMTTALDDPDTVVKCLKLGAFDYISKPVDQARLSASLGNAVGSFALRAEVEHLATRVAEAQGYRELIGRSAHIRQIEATLSRLATSPAPDLGVCGPEGCGREAAARSFHRFRKDMGQPFVAIDLQYVPEHLLKAELFGEGSNLSSFERAEHGTLFIQNVQLLPTVLQSQLADAMAVKNRSCAVVFSSSADLTKKGVIHDSLRQRIEPSTIHLLPLKDRREDIPALAEFFLSQQMQRTGKSITSIEPLAMESLEVFDWPGNIDELEKVIERAVVLCSGAVIVLDNLPREIVPAHLADLAERRVVRSNFDPKITAVLSRLEQAELSATRHIEFEEPKTITGHIVFEGREEIIPLARIERAAILSALTACNGDIQDTARRLEISRATIYRRLRRYGIDPDENRY